MSQPEKSTAREPSRYLLVTAVFRSTSLERVERALKAARIDGITVTRAKGYGEYANFFSWDPHLPVVRIEIFTPEASAAEVARLIAGAAHTGEAGDGIVAIAPIEKLMRIREIAEWECS